MSFRYRWRMTIALAAVICAAVFQLTIPQFIGDAVREATSLLSDRVVDPAMARAGLFNVAMLLLGASVLRGLFTALHNYQGEAIGQSIGYELRMMYYAKLQRLSFSYHDKVHTGDLMTRGMLDIEGVRLFTDTGIIRVVLLAILIGGGAWILIGIDFWLACVALSFVPIVGWRAIVTRLKLRHSWHLLQDKLSVLSRVMDENLAGIRVVRAFAGQEHELAKFDMVSAEAMELTRQRIGLRVRNTSLMTWVYFLSMGAVLWVGGAKVIHGSIGVGELAEFIAFMTILQMPVRQLGMMVNSVARASTSGTRLFEVMDLAVEIEDRPGARPLEGGPAVLRFENVGFAFEDAEGRKDILHDINFEVRPGQTLGIVGPPGSGKSTIAHLIPRFYDVTSGRVTINGHDVRDVTLDSLRKAVNVVQQDTFMFTAAIEYNVAYGNPWADRERINRAAESAQLAAYVDRLPRRYGTLVGERGVSLSGGQRQRLSIARSILLNPSIIVFDDSTAAIDAATEQRIRAALRDVTKNSATIIISHRLSSLMHADEILFLEDGHIVERGTHDELLTRRGRYHDLYTLQIRPDEGAVDALSHNQGGPAGASDDGDESGTPS